MYRESHLLVDLGWVDIDLGQDDKTLQIQNNPTYRSPSRWVTLNQSYLIILLLCRSLSSRSDFDLKGAASESAMLLLALWGVLRMDAVAPSDRARMFFLLPAEVSSGDFLREAIQLENFD